MALKVNNPIVFNAAFAGSLAGQLAGSALTGIASTDQVAGTYGAAAGIASNFAQALDAVVPQGAPGSITGVSTGASLPGTGGTTVVASAGVNAASQQAYNSAVFGLAFAYWYQRKSANIQASGDAGLSPTDYAYVAASIAAQLAEVTTALTADGTLV
jgi:hypothetical protein